MAWCFKRDAWFIKPVSDVWNIQEVGWPVLEWIDLAQDGEKYRALVHTVLNLRAA